MLRVRFSCRECGLEDEIVKVKPRDTPAWDLLHWMDYLTHRVATQHALLSPKCKATEITSLKIPIVQDDPNAWVGKDTDIIPPKGDG